MLVDFFLFKQISLLKQCLSFENEEKNISGKSSFRIFFFFSFCADAKS